MRQKIISASLIFILLSTQILQPLTAMAANPTTWYDSDGDGIPDHMELNGWYSGEKGATFGPYITDPYLADHDGDGLTDGEEQLYATNPKDKTSPGMYVQYESRFQTARYFSDSQYKDDESGYLRWLKAGHRTLMGAKELFTGKGDGNDSISAAAVFPATIPRLPNYKDADANEESKDVGMVVRRGTTFVIGGDTSATLTMSGPSGATLPFTKSLCSNGWDVGVPTNAKLGTYNATLSGKVMPIRVIFELPTANAAVSTAANQKAFSFSEGRNGKLSSDDVNSFGYIEKPTSGQMSPGGLVSRDETAVWWMTRQGWYGADCNDAAGLSQQGGTSAGPCGPAGQRQAYRRSSGYAQGGQTDQYRKYIFNELVMPAVAGQTTQASAINVLANLSDRELYIDYNQVHNRMNTILALTPIGGGNYKEAGGACQDAAQSFTSFTRAAGILSRPFIADHNTAPFQGNDFVQNGLTYHTSWSHGVDSTYGWYDHAAMLWDPNVTNLAGGKGSWVVARSYAGQETGSANSYGNNNTFAYTGISGYGGNLNVGNVGYGNNYNDVIIVANSAWDFWDHRVGNNGNVKDYSKLNGTNKGGEGMVNPPEYWGDTDTFGLFGGAYASNPILALEFYQGANSSVYNYHTFGYTNDYTWDARYPHGLRNFNPGVDTGVVTFWGGDGFRPSDWIRSSPPYAYGLPSGRYNATDDWLGEPLPKNCASYLGIQGAACPYSLVENQRSGRENEPTDPPTQYLDLPPVSSDTHRSAIVLDGSAPTQSNTVGDAQINGQPNSYAQDTNNDGYPDALAVDINLNVNPSGNSYIVTAELYGANNEFINSASWTGTTSPIHLVFNNADGKAGPYNLERLVIKETNVGILSEKAFFTLSNSPELANSGPIHFAQPARQARDASFNGAVMGTVSTPDTDGDGLFDKLIVPVQVNVTDANPYRVEAWLVDAKGDLVAISDDAFTSPGAGIKNLNLTFDGRAISGHGVDGPYTVEALRVIQGPTGYTVKAEIEETGWSLNYTANQFGPKILFRNDLETQQASWVTQFWSLVTDQSASYPTSGYTVNPGNSNNFLRWQNSIDGSNYAKVGLRFNSCYQLGSVNDKAMPQVQKNGAWTTVGTYSNSSQSWNERLIELDNSFDELSNLKLQFLGNSAVNMKWNIDDVRVFGWPAIKNPAVTYVSGTVGVSAVTFNGSFDSVASTLPVTYTWNFNDGTANQIQVVNSTVTNTTIVHSFPAVQLYPFTLTIQTPYDSVDFPALAGPGIAVDSADFTVNPTIPVVGTSISFVSSYLPNDATNNALASMRYTWDFGDGTIVGPSTSAASPTHSYVAGGSYQVKLTVNNGFGTATSVKIVEVKEAVVAVTSLVVNPTSPTELSPATFTAVITPSTASNPVTYAWDFGNGQSATTTTPSVVYTYPVKGNFNVSVTAQNPYGPVTAAKVLAVTVLGKPVQSTQFTYNSAGGPLSAVLTATYSTADVAQPVTVTWYVNNVIVATGSSLSYTFATADAYTVRVVASNGFGTPVSYTEVITTPFDNDYDGLSNDEEAALGTDPNNPDTDGDSLTDGEEVNGFLFTTVVSRSNGGGGTVGHPDTGSLIKTNPLNPDTDGDGLNDGPEVNLGSNPRDKDTDNDGLLDSGENGSYTTSPFDWDTDHDGLNDYLEKQIGTNGFSPDSEVAVDGTLLYDGINDLIEVGPDTAHPHDTDSDGVIDALEVDSDNDGILDDKEYYTNNGVDFPLCLSPDAACKNNDVDGDGLPNYRDTDSDGDGALDSEEGGTADSNGDGVLDFLQFNPQPVRTVAFTFSPGAPGDNDVVTFNATTGPAVAVTPITFTWDFGDGKPIVETSTPSVQHAFSPIGQYTVKVTAKNALNTTTIPSATVIVSVVTGMPISSVVVTAPMYVFIDKLVDLTAIVSPTGASEPITYTWIVDGGTPIVSTIATLPYSFTTEGPHTVLVSVSNKYMAGSSKTSTLLTLYAGYPITGVMFSYTPTLVLENTSVDFTAIVSPSNATAPITYMWQIGNFTATTTALNFSHVFTKEGIYPVILTATGNFSSATYTDKVIVGRPVQGITVTLVPTSPIQYDVITFTVMVTPTDLMTSTPPITYVWQFNDEPWITTTDIMTTRVYTEMGVYSVTIKALNEFGSVQTTTVFTIGGKPVADVFVTAAANQVMDGDRTFFTATYAPDNAALPVSYSWNFNDGTPPTISDSPNVIHEFATVGTYTVRITATNGWGTPAVTTTIMVVNGRPIRDIALEVKPDFLFDKNTATLSVFVRPYNASQPVMYQWEFGDGTVTSTISSSVYHPYNYGSYVVTVTAISNYTTPKVITGSFTVEGTAVKEVSLASGLADVTNGLKMALTATVQTVNVSTPVTYTWNFGDGSGLIVTTDSQINHTFPTSGTYTVWVTASNQFGSQSSQLQVIAPQDTDKDGLSDVQELALGTDLNKADSDGDGLLDGIEVTYNLNPNGVDSDGDTIPDGVEFGSGTQPVNTDKTLPSGGDSLIDALDLDSDDDTVLDSVEGTVDTDHDGKPDYQDLDSDNDLLPDKEEVKSGTNRILPDTDGDTLTDGQEVSAGSDPLKVDSDGDTISDTLEVGDWHNPTDTDGDKKIDALDPDSDEPLDDGVLDIDEYTSDQDPLSKTCTDTTTDQDNDGLKNCFDNDADGDGLLNYVDPDNDNDGVPDRVEYPGQQAQGRALRAGSMVGCTNTTVDRNGNGTPDCQEVDVDEDGLPNHLDLDSNGNGTLDKVEVGANPLQPVDSDQDGLPDFLDTKPTDLPKIFLPIIIRK